MRMRAARFDAASGTLSIEGVPVPDPGPGEVRVQVAACGICLSDVHLLDGSLPLSRPQVTPGHEAAGVVERTGPGVPGWQPGDRVVLMGGKPDFRCRNCMRGRPTDCLDVQLMGFAYDGAWAEYVVVPFGALTPVPDGLPLEQAAILADAVATPYAGLVDRANLRPGEAVGLWGIGGLGVHAVQIARMLGAAPLITVDPLPAARQRALQAGADVALDPAAVDVPAEVRRLTGGLGLDLAVDLVGANAVLAEAASCVGQGGRTLMIGVSLDPVRLGPGVSFALQRQTLLGHLGYRKQHLDDLVTLVATGRLDVSHSINEVLPLEQVGHGVHQLAGKVGDPIRIVVTP